MNLILDFPKVLMTSPLVAKQWRHKVDLWQVLWITCKQPKNTFSFHPKGTGLPPKFHAGRRFPLQYKLVLNYACLLTEKNRNWESARRVWSGFSVLNFPQRRCDDTFCGKKDGGVGGRSVVQRVWSMNYEPVKCELNCRASFDIHYIQPYLSLWPTHCNYKSYNMYIFMYRLFNVNCLQNSTTKALFQWQC